MRLIMTHRNASDDTVRLPLLSASYPHLSRGVSTPCHILSVDRRFQRLTCRIPQFRLNQAMYHTCSFDTISLLHCQMVKVEGSPSSSCLYKIKVSSACLCSSSPISQVLIAHSQSTTADHRTLDSRQTSLNLTSKHVRRNDQRLI